MLVTFNELPETARVWVYQSNTELDADQVKYIEEKGATFCEQWSAHSTPLKSAYKILNDRFLVIAVDEDFNVASGCSIDASVRFVREMEQHLGVSFFDRTQVAFLIDNTVYTTGLHAIKDEISTGKIEAETLTFNLQAQNIAEFENSWLVPTQDSWMKKYF